ncbi:MAG: metallophosphoesterase [Gammaproteobacteria bacterium]|nr:metallophosphoesterase [Gammaproteobacteria bacterium]
MSAHAVKRFAVNEVGIDFVVGDIHGEFVKLNEALDRVGFDPDKDRLFSVGDLIDRGPDSVAALDWMAEPWFHAVLGNHEEMALVAPHKPEMMRSWITENGGSWWLELSADQQKRFTELFKAMPLAIEVATPVGRVGIVHADVPPNVSWPELLVRINAGDNKTRQYLLWSRNRATRRFGGYRKAVAGIKHVFTGHSPVSDVACHGNVFMIDTGACYGGPLTLMPLSSVSAG